MQKIGFPIKSPDLRNASSLQEYYETVNISRTTFFHNLVSVAEFSSYRRWSALGKPTDRDEWDMTVPTVNVSRWPLLSSYLMAFVNRLLHNDVFLFVNRSDLT